MTLSGQQSVLAHGTDFSGPSVPDPIPHSQGGGSCQGRHLDRSLSEVSTGWTSYHDPPTSVPTHLELFIFRLSD